MKVLGCKVTNEIYISFRKLANNNVNRLLRQLVIEYIEKHSSHTETEVNPIYSNADEQTQRDGYRTVRDFVDSLGGI